MSRKSKINSAEKVKIVEQYLNGEIGMRQASKELSINHKSIQEWVSIYKSKGPVGLLDQPHNSHYSMIILTEKVRSLPSVQNMGFVQENN